jgi:hypothetical protein
MSFRELQLVDFLLPFFSVFSTYFHSCGLSLIPIASLLLPLFFLLSSCVSFLFHRQFPFLFRFFYVSKLLMHFYFLHFIFSSFHFIAVFSFSVFLYFSFFLLYIYSFHCPTKCHFLPFFNVYPFFGLFLSSFIFFLYRYISLLPASSSSAFFHRILLS